MKDEKLRALQLNLLKTLKFVDEFCKKHKITYYMIYGTLIGTVRHKGFIPWDDDLDIAMPLEDYNRFCKLFVKENTGKYFLQTRDTDENYYLDFAKIRDTSTTLIEEKNINDMNIVLGTYIDIFPLVGVPNNKFLKKVQKINRALYFHTDKNMINNKYLKLIADVVVKIFGKNTIRKKCYKNMIKYSCDSSNNWFSCFGGMYEGNIHPKKYYGKPIYLKFEDMKVPVPNNYDALLRKTYGDYMKIPSNIEKKNWQHSIAILDLKKPYTYYKNKQK